MEAILLILGFIAYAALIGLIFYVRCNAANEVDSNDDNF